MNLKQAKDALRPLGLSINRKEGEYRVAPLVTPRMPPKKAEDWAYYTDCLDDAVSTGRHMVVNSRSSMRKGSDMCNNMVTQYVPKGYGFKEVQTRCGMTSIHGTRLQCDDCAKDAERRYPQGWRYVPGDVCEHGVYVGGDHDCACWQCESE